MQVYPTSITTSLKSQEGGRNVWPGRKVNSYFILYISNSKLLFSSVQLSSFTNLSQKANRLLKAWFSIGKSMLTLPSPPLLPHVPKSTFSKRACSVISPRSPVERSSPGFPRSPFWQMGAALATHSSAAQAAPPSLSLQQDQDAATGSLERQERLPNQPPCTAGLLLCLGATVLNELPPLINSFPHRAAPRDFTPPISQENQRSALTAFPTPLRILGIISSITGTQKLVLPQPISRFSAVHNSQLVRKTRVNYLTILVATATALLFCLFVSSVPGKTPRQCSGWWSSQ